MLLLQCEGGSKKTFRFLPFEFNFLLLRRFDFRLPPLPASKKGRLTGLISGGGRRRRRKRSEKGGRQSGKHPSLNPFPPVLTRGEISQIERRIFASPLSKYESPQGQVSPPTSSRRNRGSGRASSLDVLLFLLLLPSGCRHFRPPLLPPLSPLGG